MPKCVPVTLNYCKITGKQKNMIYRIESLIEFAETKNSKVTTKRIIFKINFVNKYLRFFLLLEIGIALATQRFQINKFINKIMFETNFHNLFNNLMPVIIHL